MHIVQKCINLHFAFSTVETVMVKATKSVPRIIESKGLVYAGYHSLDERPAFKLAMQQVGKRWYLYAGHLWHRGWSVLDVTDPSSPELVRFVKGPDNTTTSQVTIGDGILITALQIPREERGGNSGKKSEEGVLIWDIARDSTNPELLGRYNTGGNGTHRNLYTGGKFAYLAGNPKGFYGNIMIVLDISDPSEPIEASRFWWKGQDVGKGQGPDTPISLHGPAYVWGNRAYLSYGGIGMVILDITDPYNPEFISRFSFGNLGSRLANRAVCCHSAVPVPGKNMVIVTSEPMDRTHDYNYVYLLDISDEQEPNAISCFPTPMPQKQLPYHNYVEKGARFGPHNLHHYYRGQEYLYKSSSTFYIAYCNAGIRKYDISDPYLPEEVGCFVPEDPYTRIGIEPTEKLVCDFDDVLVDSRGYIYCSEKNSGLYILRDTES